MQEAPQTLTPLLERLSIGASQAVYSVEDWAERLGDVPFAKRFLFQLRTEWLPAEPPSEACHDILEACQDYIAEWNSGWPNLWAHTLRVTGYALRIAAEAGINPEHAFAVAMLHDVGKFDEMRDGEAHEAIAGRVANEILADIFSKLDVYAIANAVSKQGSSSDPLVKLLYDADKLDKIGASGILRRLSQVVILPNALNALDRVATDLGRFPAMKHPFMQSLADSKQAYTSAFIQQVRRTVVVPPV